MVAEESLLWSNLFNNFPRANITIFRPYGGLDRMPDDKDFYIRLITLMYRHSHSERSLILGELPFTVLDILPLLDNLNSQAIASKTAIWESSGRGIFSLLRDSDSPESIAF